MNLETAYIEIPDWDHSSTTAVEIPGSNLGAPIENLLDVRSRSMDARWSGPTLERWS
jgi:hypothetical protein